MYTIICRYIITNTHDRATQVDTVEDFKKIAMIHTCNSSKNNTGPHMLYILLLYYMYTVYFFCWKVCVYSQINFNATWSLH